MTSIRIRLIAILLMTTGAVWCCAVFWTYLSTQHQLERVLDARLTEAARMVSSLITDHHIEVAAAVDAVAASDARPEFAAAQTGYNRQLSCQIWSLQGQLISRSESAPAVSLAGHAKGYEDTVINGERWRVYAVVNPALGVRVLVGDSLDMRGKLVGDVIKGQLIPALAIIPVLAALIWFSVDRGLAPLSRVAGTLSGRSADALQPVEESGAPREVRPLLNSLNALFQRVSAAREREKTFIAYAAHELKTPLAGLKTQAQVALKSDDDAIRNAALRHISTSVDRTGRLVRQLIDMAAVDSADASRMAGKASIPDVLTDVRADLDSLRTARTVTIKAHVEVAREPVVYDRMLLALALKNILENAILYAPAGSDVAVSVRREGNELHIEVADPGPGMTPEEAEHLMGRFNRGRHDGKGTGLGLAIVDMAVRKLNGRLSLEKRAKNFVAEITLPLDHPGQIGLHRN